MINAKDVEEKRMGPICLKGTAKNAYSSHARSPPSQHSNPGFPEEAEMFLKAEASKATEF